jgi:hypothetical protein
VCCACGEVPYEESSFGTALLTELGVSQRSVSGTIAAASQLCALPAAERPLVHLTADAPLLPDGHLSPSGRLDTPWTSGPAEQDSWAAAVTAHAAWLQNELRLNRAEAAAVFPAFPFALLLPAGALEATAAFLLAQGLTQDELGNITRKAPRLLGFSPTAHLAPAFAYLQGCGLGQPALLGLLRTQPSLLVAAVVHKARTDSAARCAAALGAGRRALWLTFACLCSELHAAYQLQSEERQKWAIEMAGEVRASMQQRR